MAPKRFQRRTWLIDTDIQVRLAVKLALCLTAYLILFCVIALWEPILMLFQGGLGYGTALAEIRAFLAAILMPLLFAIASMVLHGILILHNLAGPVYRIRRGLEALGDGRLDDVMHLREKDYLKSVASLYNEATGRLRLDVEDARAETKAILAAGPSDEVREHAERLEEILGFYRLGPEDEPETEEEPDAQPETAEHEASEA
jgi:methyl-accepting chemotaxis protein